MKRCLIISSILLFLVVQSFGQIKAGAQQIALAHSNISCSKDAISVFNNPAGTVLNGQREINLFYSPAPFDIKELSTAYAAYLEPTSSGNFAAGFSVYGFELYKQTEFAVGYSKFLTDDFALGITTLYKNISIKNYGSSNVLVFNLGGIAQLNEKMGLGFLIENVTRSNLSEDENQLPMVFWGGLHISYIKDLLICAAIKKEIGFNPSLRFGVEYQPLEYVVLRFGTQNEPVIFSGGLGIIYNFAEFDYAVSSHSDLGFTHQFGIRISFNK